MGTRSSRLVVFIGFKTTQILSTNWSIEFTQIKRAPFKQDVMEVVGRLERLIKVNSNKEVCLFKF